MYLFSEKEKINMQTNPKEKLMYDIHAHIIPTVDDGSWSLEMSYQMLYMAYRQGIQKVVATPHSEAFDQWPDMVMKCAYELKEFMQSKLPEIELYIGCEVLCRRDYMKNILEKLHKGIYPSMNGSPYVLCEFSKRTTVEEILYCTCGLQSAGWIPIIAHAERYKCLFTDEKYLNMLKEDGCKIQINIDSVYDEYDETIKRNALTLIEQKQVDFLGTDAHRMNHRPPNAKNGLDFLYSHYEKEYIDKIAFGNAGQLLLI